MNIISMEIIYRVELISKILKYQIKKVIYIANRNE